MLGPNSRSEQCTLGGMEPGLPSLWIDEADAPTLPPLSADAHRCDILVIGLGVTGTRAALELADSGHEVLAVDAHGFGHGATARSGGFLLVEHAIEYPARRDRFGAQAMRTIVEMARASHRYIESHFSAPAEHRRCSSLILPMEDDEREQATLARAAALLIEDGVPCQTGVSVPELHGYAPGICIPEDGEVHPGRLLAAMGRALMARDVACHRGRVLELDVEARRARTSEATIEYGAAIVAVNGWVHALLPEVPISPQRAQMLATKPMGPRTLAPVCYAGWGYDYFRQRDDGRVLMGGRRSLHRKDESTDRSVVTEPVQRDLERYLARHMPGMGPFEIEARWSGIMGFSPDELPFHSVLADGDGRPATHVIGGMTGHGLGLGPASGEALARAVTGDLGPEHERRLEVLDVARLWA